MIYSQFVSEIAKLSPASTFLTLTEYKNTKGEISNYSILFNTDYRSAVEKSIAILENYQAESNDGDISELKAKSEILARLYGSLESLKKEEVKPSPYVHFVNAKGTEFIKGVMLHEETSSLYLYGFVVHKKVLVGVESKKKVKSVKEKLLDKLPISKFRQFRIDPNNVKRITVQAITLLPPGASK